MPNRMAVILGISILCLILADQLANDGRAGVFAMRKFVDLLEYLAFWR
jgi:hypothetical protein